LAAVPGIVLLRSIGKFFGLPGLRLGFLIAEPNVLAKIEAQIGPWAVCGSAQWLGRKALLDRQWQEAMQVRLERAATQQGALIAERFKACYQKLIVTPLFITMVLPLALAETIQSRCYAQGLSVRVYHHDGDTAYMRWGLASDPAVLVERLSTICLTDLAA
jgi:cobalamin biosynthetic protein CobC